MLNIGHRLAKLGLVSGTIRPPCAMSAIMSLLMGIGKRTESYTVSGKYRLNWGSSNVSLAPVTTGILGLIVGIGNLMVLTSGIGG